MRQGKLFRSARAATKLDANAQFNVILADLNFQKWILDLNKSQLFKGEDSLGVELRKIGGGYSFTTEFLNQGRTFSYNPLGVEGGSKQKKQGGSPFLLDTGAYYDSYTIRLGNASFNIDSDPMKDGDNLEDAYGNKLEGLQDENLRKIIDVVRGKFIQETRKLLRG